MVDPVILMHIGPPRNVILIPEWSLKFEVQADGFMMIHGQTQLAETT